MVKHFAFMKKRDDMSAEAFRDYYETRHVPLVLSFAPSPPLYRRNFVTGRSAAWPDDSFAFDVVTEIGFPDEESYAAWLAKLDKAAIDADEARFMHPTTRRPHRIVIVDERVSSA